MDPSKIDLSHQKTLYFNCIKFLIGKKKEKKKKRERAKTRLENNFKHEMGWVEKMNTRFKK